MEAHNIWVTPWPANIALSLLPLHVYCQSSAVSTLFTSLVFQLLYRFWTLYSVLPLQIPGAYRADLISESIDLRLTYFVFDQRRATWSPLAGWYLWLMHFLSILCNMKSVCLMSLLLWLIQKPSWTQEWLSLSIRNKKKNFLSLDYNKGFS